MKSEDSSVVGNPVIEYLVEYTEGLIKKMTICLHNKGARRRMN